MSTTEAPPSGATPTYRRKSKTCGNRRVPDNVHRDHRPGHGWLALPLQPGKEADNGGPK